MQFRSSGNRVRSWHSSFTARLALCHFVVFPAVAANASTLEADQFATLQALVEVRQASEQLRRPVSVTERSRVLRTYAHLWSDEGQTHRIAINVLATSRIPAAAFALAEALRDVDYPFRLDIAQALALEPKSIAVPALVAAAADQEPELRRAAISALGASPAVRVQGPHLEQLRQRFLQSIARDPDPGVREAALISLLATGGLAAVNQAIKIAMADEHILLRCQALRLIAFFGAHAPDPKLANSARDRLWKVVEQSQERSVLARAYDKHRYASRLDPQPGCVDPMVAAVRNLGVLAQANDTARLGSLASSHADPAVREAAVFALSQTGDEAALEAVLPALADENIAVRKAAVNALPAFDDKVRVADALGQTLRNGSSIDREAAADALARMAGQEDALVHALGDESVQVRRAAEHALLQRDDPEVLRPLIEALSQPPRIARRAARILAAIEMDEADSLLIEVLESRQPPAAAMAALALGLRGHAGSRVALESAATDSDEAVALASIRALQDLGERESLPTLVSVAASTDGTRIEVAARLAVSVIRSTNGLSSTPTR